MICACGHPAEKHVWKPQTRHTQRGECVALLVGVYCTCKEFRAAQSTEETTMPKKKRKKQQTPGTPRVGNTTAKPKSNKVPALAEYSGQIAVINAVYKEKHFSADVLADGMIKLGGGIDCYASPSAAAMAITDKPTNGWTFWTYTKDGEQVPLDTLRGKKSPLKTKAAAA